MTSLVLGKLMRYGSLTVEDLLKVPAQRLRPEDSAPDGPSGE
jgi:hypothetical protein